MKDSMPRRARQQPLPFDHGVTTSAAFALRQGQRIPGSWTADTKPQKKKKMIITDGLLQPLAWGGHLLDARALQFVMEHLEKRDKILPRGTSPNAWEARARSATQSAIWRIRTDFC